MHDHTQHQSHMPTSAPQTVAYCQRCGAPMETRPVNSRPRRVCTACGFIHFTDPKVGVGVLVVDDNGRILLVRRVMDPERGQWSIPAGFLDQGEDPRETAVREVKEETGLTVIIERLVDVYFNPPPQGGASIFVLYEGRPQGGALAAGDDADRVDFFSLDQLPELAFASTHAAVRLLREKE